MRIVVRPIESEPESIQAEMDPEAFALSQRACTSEKDEGVLGPFAVRGDAGA